MIISFLQDYEAQLGIHGIYVNSSIANEGALGENKVPYKISEGWFIPTKHHWTDSGPLTQNQIC